MIATVVDRASRIQGWMSRPELEWLATQAYDRRVVEVGSFMGRSTKAMALARKVFAVDDFRGVHEDAKREGKNPDDYPVLPDLEQTFRANLEPEIRAGKVEVLPYDSLTAAPRFSHGEVDMVFIDGSHMYPAPLHDIKAWHGVPSRLLCGHDAHDPNVQRSLEEAGLDAEIVVDNIWAVWL